MSVSGSALYVALYSLLRGVWCRRLLGSHLRCTIETKGEDICHRLRTVTDAQVDTLWIFNGGFGDWWHDVHEDSQAELISLKKDCSFPRIPCLTMDYTPEQTGYLTNLAAWNIFEIREQIKSFLD